eukprot:gnl/TRDRNA2_/TRDRNA2_136076_c0_seq3.p1 gnl/TRDRNA2_/TRDRNA2_136076_c0~~gnl/TRDRNA2_/TRDRNA2_136076_c0_seq3.p1  ORF type:complete len:316 (+),score=74.15 gnl/TRDRNA2_/TRDRNA2_136076_c0_seq3:133-1080(+)
MSAVAETIRATRGAFQDAAEVAAWVAASPGRDALHGKSLVYFNGAFSPPTTGHAHIVSALAKDFGADALWLDPEPARHGKQKWLDETLEARIEICEIMVEDLAIAHVTGVGTLRHDLGPERGSSTELFHVLRALLGGHGQGRLLWAMGADVFEGMRYWTEKARSCLQAGVTCDGVMIFVRNGFTQERLRAAAVEVLGREPLPGEVNVLPMPEALASTSSHEARKALILAAAGASDSEDSNLMPAVVRTMCLARPDLLRVYEDQVVNTPDVTPVFKSATLAERISMQAHNGLLDAEMLPPAHVNEDEDGSDEAKNA